MIMGNFTSALRPSLMMTLLFALLLGIVYPLILVAIGQIAFPFQANGSLVRDGDRVIGSAILAQGFASDRYFHPRPSAAGKGYDATASSGSNLGPAAQALHDRVAGDIKTMTAAMPGRPVPADLVTTSASGLDPDISPEAALYQIPRVAEARGLAEAQLRVLVASATDHPLFGVLGEDRVNVFSLNRQLDLLGAKMRR
jgi:K+-transporting ATPase ATPase C chain